MKSTIKFNAGYLGKSFYGCDKCRFPELTVFDMIMVSHYEINDVDICHIPVALCPMCLEMLSGFNAEVCRIEYAESKEKRMKLLSGARCYLAGPIESCLDHGSSWRKEITSRLNNLGVTVLDPTDKLMSKLSKSMPGKEGTKELELIKWLKQERRYDDLAYIMKAIRNIDLRLTDIADFIIAYFPDGNNTVGTWEEIFNANRQKKPIFIVWENGIEDIPNWLWGTLDNRYFFENLPSLLEYLQHLGDGTREPFDNRWATFDFAEAI